MNDKEIILKIKNGELDYFCFIVKKYSDPIYRLINRKIFDKQEVDDLIQETFISFYKAINRFDVDRPVLPYLYKIAQNVMKMYFRSHKHLLPLDERILIGEQDEIIFNEDYSQILKILPQEQKKALELLIEGYSYKEISGLMGKPVNTVKTIIRRARLKVQQKNENNR